MIREQDLVFTDDEMEELDPSFVIEFLTKRAKDIYALREKLFGDKIMRELERVILLKNVDRYWMDHIDAMEELQKGIRLRAYGQHDPVVEYRIEGFDMFDEMIAAIREDTARMMLTVKLRINAGPPKREQVAKPTATSSDGTDVKRPVQNTKKVGRNDPCPCGSGKKYKNCCGKDEN